MRVPFVGQEKCRDAVGSLYSARSEPTMSRRVLSSPNHTSGLILVNIEGRLATISELSPLMRHIRAVAVPATGQQEASVRLSSLPPLRVDMFDMISREMGGFMSIGALVALAIVYFPFRRPSQDAS